MKPQIDLSVYLVLDPVLCGGFEGMVKTAVQAASAGATCVQLRAPQWKKRELTECARALKKSLFPLNIPLIIDDHADVCVAADADGLHVGQQDLLPEDARALIGPDRILGLSITNPSQLADVDTKIIDYLGVGPIWATATKPDADLPLGLEGLKLIADQKPCPIVAIGSVKTANAASLIEAGADGVAVVSAICGQLDVIEATVALAAVVRDAKHGA